ncbi:hypothetical protein GCM10011494_26540 [Novosphingobium endophyticum]|uniref:Uncharacterized protein n=1 Tax=Novosphingobium endophyticum TaxID=1955250 RepID=A0A916TUQ4_9SPHN|nr:DUF6118 family protein [Novosphingobium endophyticum]GGC06612.1 hypothetical protein GCM10011494_26540 [Novosphingobium endophyticum]
MDDNDMDTEERDPAAEAFLRLEGQIALMRLGVEKLAAERADIVIPDYSATLGEMTQNIAWTLDTLRDIVAKPAMSFTPEDWARRIDSAALQARRTDHAELRASCNRFDSASRELQTVVAIARTARDQRRRLLWAAGGGLLAGILLWSVFPGAFLRALPQSWLMPEGIAARVLREPTLWAAGIRLMQADSPRAWQALADAAEVLTDNRQAFEKCQAAATKARKSVRCTLDVRPDL